MDFITGLPKSEGKIVIMVIVVRLTKYAHFCALSHPFKASTVATTFMETVQKLHGSPKIIVSDRDPIFTGHSNGYPWQNGRITLPFILQQK